MKMKKERLFFDFKDNNQEKEFKINLLSVLDALGFLIGKGVLKDFSEHQKSEIKNKYGKSKKTYGFSYEEIDTFDWDTEAKYAEEEQRQEKEYEEYMRRKNSK